MKIADIVCHLDGLDRTSPLDAERYATCMEAYEAASDQRDRIRGWFVDEVASLLPASGARVLSVGCGSGELDVELFATAARHASQLRYVGIEPDPRQCDRFVSRLESVHGDHARVEGHATRFEDFDEERGFDLVLMVHSLYYMEHPRVVLEKARRLVADDGRLVVLVAANDTLNELASAFWELQQEEPVWFSEDLHAYLMRSELAFERRRIEARLDVTACCEPLSEQGRRIADFLAQVSIGGLPERLRRMIFRYLEDTARADGCHRWLAHDVDVFTIASASPRHVVPGPGEACGQTTKSIPPAGRASA